MFHPTDQISPVNVDSTSIAQASPTGKRCCGRTNRPSLLGISINEVINLNHLCQGVAAVLSVRRRRGEA
jgi:hypothetical protein